MSSKPILDITLQESYNKYFLAISDISEYPQNWLISNSTCEITSPGFSKVAVAFTPKSVNFYKAAMLGITCDEDEECVPLPDGVYTVKFSISPNTIYFVEKSFMKVDLIRCQYGEAFLKVDFSIDCNRDEKLRDKKYLQNIHILIEGSIAAVNDCDVDRAYKYYNKAKQMLNNFHKTGCGCK